MFKISLVPAASLALAITASPLAAACKSTDPKLAGGYELRGVMETASSIYLAENGEFGYMLTVGAFDEIARGCWSRVGDRVVLSPTDIRANDGNPTFKRLTLTLDAKGGLIRFHEGRRVGTYVKAR